MARPLRVEYAGAIYHVTVRGNARQDIFRDDGDRRLLYARFAKCIPKYGVRIYLFCLMRNHFHLVVETPRANLGRFMQSILTSYTVCYNLRHRCHGHLTQGRYGARLVSGDEYLLKLSRYVHLNPVKIKKIALMPLSERIVYLREHEWSSYRSYIGTVGRLSWVEYEPMLRLIGGRPKDWSAQYQTFVESGVAADDEEFRKALNLSARSIGDEEFREQVDERHGDLLRARKHPEDVALRKGGDTGQILPADVMAAIALAAGVSVEGLKERRRNWTWKGIAAKLLVTHSGLTQRDCADWLGVRAGSTVGYQMEKAERELAVNKDLAHQVARVTARLLKRKLIRYSKD
jgi:REP element-mobilizing transposase RayT